MSKASEPTQVTLNLGKTTKLIKDRKHIAEKEGFSQSALNL